MGNRIYNLLPKYALYFGVIGGIAGLLVDFDHLSIFSASYFIGLEGRPFHVPLLIIAGCIAICCGACFRRLVNKVVLENDKKR